MMLSVRLPLLPSAVAALIALPALAGAQARGGSTRDTVPVSMLPPAGKCRIWMFGVPAAQQPATTDCATALRQKPANGMVLYGPAQRDAESERFDPKVGGDTRGSRRADDLRTNGSPAEQDIERRRQADQRARQLDERRERDERARREAMDRAALASRAPTRDRSPSAPSGGGTTAVPRSSTANSTGAGSSAPPQSPPKAPPEGKKKPE